MRIPHTIDINSWGLSKSVSALLRHDAELISRLDRVRHQRSFPPQYRPKTIEVFYDDVCWIKSVDGRVVHHEIPSDKSITTSIEVRFDGETAMFSIDSETIVDRTTGSVSLLELLGNKISALIDSEAC